MFKKILSIVNFNYDKKVKKLMVSGIKFSFILTLFATLIMAIYISYNQSYIVYEVGTSLFKSATMFISMFIIVGTAFNYILKERNI